MDLRQFSREMLTIEQRIIRIRPKIPLSMLCISLLIISHIVVRHHGFSACL